MMLPLFGPVKRLVFNNESVGQYVASRAKCAYNPETDTTIGVVDDSRGVGWVRGGIIYTAHTGSSCFVHIAGESGWLTQDMVFAGFDYPFRQLGYTCLLGIVEAANEPAVRFDLRLGFKVVYRIPKMFPSGDGILVRMDREECSWLKLKPKYLTPTH